MVKDSQRLPSTMRGSAPCKNCSEKTPGCHANCPKDQRGEYGYGAWVAEFERVKGNRKAYLDQYWRKKRWTT